MKLNLSTSLALVFALSLVASAQDVEILSAHVNGLVMWTDAPEYSNCTYRVEWSNGLKSNDWSYSWTNLTNIPHSISGMAASVPMFYRIVMNPRTITVATNGNDASGSGTPDAPFATIQKAIDAAGAGDQILVKEGTYSGVGNRDLTINGKSISVVSEIGPSATIIDCGGVSRAVVFSGTMSNTLFSGFTIKNGYYNEAGNWGYGGIVRINNPAAPIVDRCILQSNTVVNSYSTAQPALVTIDTFSPASIRNCLIIQNSVSGGTFTGGGYGALVRSGGDFYAVTNSIVNCTIADNTISGNSRTSFGFFRGEIANVIDWNNAGAQVFTNSNHARYAAVISQTMAVSGAVSNNPLFVGSGSYLLQAGSPAVNTGTNSTWMVGSKDTLGNPRIENNIVDRGAVESPY